MTDLKLDRDEVERRITSAYDDARIDLEHRFEKLKRDADETVLALGSEELKERIGDLVVKAEVAVVMDVPNHHGVRDMDYLTLEVMGQHMQQRFRKVPGGQFRAVVLLFRQEETQMIAQEERHGRR